MKSGKPLYLHLLLVLFTSCWFACKPTTKDDGYYPMGYEYFPVNIGHEITYDVDSLVYDDFKDSIYTYSYQKREVITDTFRSLDGKLNQRIAWYYRNHDTDTWSLSHVGSSLLNFYTGEVMENNERLVKLIFPVAENKSWNGFIYTAQTNKQNFYYDQVGANYQGINENFLNTLTVVQQDDSNLIELRQYKEIYAPLVGMVYQQKDSLDTQFNGGGQPKTKGLRYRLRVRSYIK